MPFNFKLERKSKVSSVKVPSGKLINLYFLTFPIIFRVTFIGIIIFYYTYYI